jgi:hypothetical protein
VGYLPPVLLQGFALWLLLLALLLVEDDPRPAAPRPASAEAPPDGPDACPFCGAHFVDQRRCWCGADGHWL